MDDMERAADTSKRSSSAASFTLGLVELFKESTIIFLRFVCEVASYYGEDVPDTIVRLKFMISRYVLGDIFRR